MWLLYQNNSFLACYNPLRAVFTKFILYKWFYLKKKQLFKKKSEINLDVYFDGLDRGLFVYLFILEFLYVSFLGQNSPECIVSSTMHYKASL